MMEIIRDSLGGKVWCPIPLPYTIVNLGSVFPVPCTILVLFPATQDYVHIIIGNFEPVAATCWNEFDWDELSLPSLCCLGADQLERVDREDGQGPMVVPPYAPFGGPNYCWRLSIYLMVNYTTIILLV